MLFKALCGYSDIFTVELLQVSQVYQTVEFKRLLSLVPFATEFQLERAIVDVALANELQVCTFVDYCGTLVFAKHAQQSTIGRKIWLSMHPRNFGGHVTIHVCPYFNLSICTTRVPVSKLNLYKHNLFFTLLVFSSYMRF